jgi:hypothetical protein
MRVAENLIIGSAQDVHVASVLEHTNSAATLVLDGQRLSTSTFTLSDEGMVIDIDGDLWALRDKPVVRGWVRRLAPETWQEGVVAGSRAAAEHGAWLSLIAALTRSTLVHWLTTLDSNLMAENKAHQLRVAKSLGVLVPVSIVSNRMVDILREIPGPRIVKTLGPGHYVEDGTARVVFTQRVEDDALALIEGGLPLLFQEELVAREHLRVVVVGRRVWTCALTARGLPIDWRAEPSAHDAFVAVETSDEVRDGALRVNKALQLGYASQDWIVTAAGAHLVDVNPGGQWLFLPEPYASEISMAIAQWLGGTDE